MKGEIMKKLLWMVSLAMFGINLNALANDSVIKLPQPNMTGGMPLMEAIDNRHTERSFGLKEIDNQVLSEILYCAWGVSHDGKRTIPTSMNKQNLEVYVIKADGAWLYDGKENTLTQVSKEDLRPFFNQQDYMKNVPLNLLYVGTDAKNSPMHAGSAYQNVGLYAASRGLNNVVRGYFDKKGVAKALNLKEEEVLVSQALGWPNN